MEAEDVTGGHFVEEIDGRRDRQLEQELERRIRFRGRHPRLDRVPVVGPVLRVLYGLKPSHLIGLVAVLLVFTAVKAPHLHRTFTGLHSLKYNSYVEPALHMAEHDDPLRYQRPYQASPGNPDGRSATFGSLPLLEWGLYLTYEILPLEDLEIETRAFTHLVGIAILVVAFLFLRRWMPAEAALLTLLIAALNPIVAFSTYVTVNDGLLIFWTFASLLLLNRFLQSDELRHLYLAGLAGGIGVAVKLSVFLWLVPIVGVLLVTRSVSNARRISSATFFGVVTLLPLVAFRTSVDVAPSEPVKAGLLTGLWLIGFIGLYYANSSLEDRFRRAMRTAARSPSIVSALFAGLAVLAGFVFLQLRLYRYAENYMTDLNLILEPRLYLYMASEQFRDYLTPPVAYLAGTGGLLLLAAKWSDAKRLFVALATGSLVYWIVASKAMFFHNYYTVILMLTAALAAGVLIYEILRRFPRPFEKVVLLLLVAAVFLRPAYRATDVLLGQEQDIRPLVGFVQENTNPDDLLLHEGYYSAVGIYARRGLVRTYRLTTPEFREELSEHGFEGALKRHNIKYLITPFEHPTYKEFAPVFESVPLDGPTYDRSYNVCQIVGLDCPVLASEHEDLDRIVAEHDIPSRFRLVARVGRFKIFGFDGANPDLSSTTPSVP